jgi:hypothetical protein
MHLVVVVCVLHNDTICGNTLVHVLSRMISRSETEPLVNLLAAYCILDKTTAPNIALIQAPDGGKPVPAKTLRQYYVVPAMPPLS